MGKYYNYTLTNSLTGRIFYVGKGTRNRFNYHEKAARKGDPSPRSAYIRRIWAYGGHVIKSKVFESDDEQEVLENEVVLISKHRPLMNVANHTTLGLGKESIESMREDMIKRAEEANQKRVLQYPVDERGSLLEQWDKLSVKKVDDRLNLWFQITEEAIQEYQEWLARQNMKWG